MSLGEAIDRHGPDALRYFLLREVGFEADGNFTWERFDERYTADLADGLGNLASRSLAMLAKYREGIVPDAPVGHHAGPGGPARRSTPTPRRWTRWTSAVGPRRPGSSSATANLYIQQVAPWALAKAGKEAELDAALAALGRALYRLAVLAAPVHPGQGPTALAIPRAAGDAADAALGQLSGPPVGGPRYQQARGAVPQAARLSRS